MLRGLTAKQFAGWEHYAELEPFNEMRQDYRIASIVQMLYNVNRSSKSSAWSLDDALLRFGDSQPAKKKQSVEDQILIAKMWVNAFNAGEEEQPVNKWT